MIQDDRYLRKCVQPLKYDLDCNLQSARTKRSLILTWLSSITLLSKTFYLTGILNLSIIFSKGIVRIKMHVMR